MTCPKCSGSGKDKSSPAVRIKVPGMQRYKLAAPLCKVCGGSGRRETAEGREKHVGADRKDS
jgi:hypothetical protein